MNTELLDAVEGIGKSFDVYKKQEGQRIADLTDRIESLEAKADRPGRTGDAKESKLEQQHRDEFAAWLRKPGDDARKRRLSDAQETLAQETKDVSIGTDSAGGYALPKQIWQSVEYRLRQANPFRRICNVVNTSSNDFHFLISLGDATSGWVAETGTRSATVSPELRDRVPTMGELYALPTASEWSLDDAAFDVQDWLVTEISDQFASAEATAFVSGNGSARPTGFLNTSPVTTADAASPTRNAAALQYVGIQSADSPTVLNWRSIVNLVHALNERYLDDSCAFVMNRTTLSQLHQLSDSQGRPIVTLNPSAGLPMTIVGFPVYTTDAMPTYALSANAIAFGSWRRGYLIADRVPGMRILADPYSVKGKVSFYCRRRVGGCVLNCDALKILQLSD